MTRLSAFILAAITLLACFAFAQNQPQAGGPTAVASDAQTPAQPNVAPGVPRLVKFGGLLKDASGNLLTNTVGVVFAIYSEQTGSVSLWQETQNVQFSQGRYAVFLGASTSEGIPAELFAAGQPRWLGVKALLPGEEEQPRVLLASVPYALKAVDADTLGGLPASAFVRAQDVGSNTSPATPVSPGVSITANPASPSAVRSAQLADVTTAGGTANAIPLFTGASTVGNSVVTQSGTNVGINTTSPAQSLDVFGGILHVTGSSTPTTAVQGAYLGWNALTGSTGETDFINNAGTGPGGFAFMNTPASGSPRSTLLTINPIVVPPGVLPPGALTTGSVNGVVDAAQFSGADIGAQVNAAIASLPGGCGEVFIPALTTSPFYYTQTTPIIKPACVRLRGASALATVLNYTPTSGWAVILADSAKSTIYPEGAIEDLTLQAAGGAGSAAVGIYIGGRDGATGSPPANVNNNNNNPYGSGWFGDHQNINRVRVYGFGTGIQWGNNAWSDTIFESVITNNGTGLYFAAGPLMTQSGERIVILSSSIQNSSFNGLTVGCSPTPYSKGFCNDVDFHIIASSFDHNGQSGTNASPQWQIQNGNIGTNQQVSITDSHFETSSAYWIQNFGVLTVSNTVFTGAQSCTSPPPPSPPSCYLIDNEGPVFTVSGSALYNAGSGPLLYPASLNGGVWLGSTVQPVKGVYDAPTVNSVNGFQFNGTPGYTGTISSGTCTFTIQGGIITNVNCL
jgi:hypothetical protein